MRYGRLALVLFAVLSGYAGAAEAETDTSLAAVRTATTGVTRGSLNPGKRGLALPASPKVMIIPINDQNSRYGMIDDWQAIYVERRLRRAQNENFDLVVLEIDTYGGSVPACERINRAIANCRVPVVAYVKLKAFSGGAILSLGCRAIVMAPGSRIGGAKGVSLLGDLPADMRQKVDSDLRAMVTNLCDANAHPHAIAIGMVNSEAEVLETGDPQARFLTGDALADMKVKPAVVHTWKRKGEILTLTANEAVNVGLASGQATDNDELFLGLALTPSETEYADITASERAARALGHPLWRVLLVVIGLVGLIWELKAPGHGVGYGVFAFCMGIFFWLQVFSDNAGLLEIALFGIGAAIVAVELFILPTFGALGFAGFAMILTSIVLAFVPNGVGIGTLFKGGTSLEMDLLMEGLKWAAVTIVAVVAAAVTALLKGAALPGLRRMALRAEVLSTAHDDDGRDSQSREPDKSVGPAGTAPAPQPLAALVGQIADAETVLIPAGKVRLGGITYDAVSDGAFIEAQSKVVILRVSSGNLVVRAVK